MFKNNAHSSMGDLEQEVNMYYEEQEIWTQEEIEQFEFENHKLSYYGLCIQDFI